MDMNSFFLRRAEARAERGDTLQDARDRWAIDRSNQIVEALAGVDWKGDQAVYPSALTVRPNGSKTVGGQTTVSVFTEFAWWLAENSDLMTGPAIRDLLTNPMRVEIKLFRKFADEHAEMECGLLSDDYFADDSDWEAA
jgi:hypothetical protein